jgi:virulence factor Mce-like protein
MNRRRPGPSVLANPVLVGAVTVLVVFVAVFLSYNANSGLPFVPTYDVQAVVPDAAELVPGNDVRIGGTRVGVVKAITAVPGDRTPTARLAMALAEDVRPLRADTRVVIRQRSNLGLKFVELVPGASGAALPAGGTIRLEQAAGIVDLDDALSAFDAPARDAVQGVTRELGAGLAGRGGDLGDALGGLEPTLASLQVVARTLRQPGTGLTGFLRGAESAARSVAPVAGTLGELLGAGATTFAAVNAERGALAQTLAQAPGTERVAADGLRRTRPLLTETATFLHDAAPGARALPAAARTLERALADSGPVLQRARPTATALQSTLTALRRLSVRPSLPASLRRLTNAMVPLQSALTTITPFQTRCNYLGLWGQNVPGVISEGDALGTWFRFLPVVVPDEMFQSPTPSPNLHASDSGDTGYGGECEIGNETYVPGRQLGGAPGGQPLATRDTAPPAKGSLP